MRLWIRVLSLLACMVGLNVGCTTSPWPGQARPDDPSYAPIQPEYMQAPVNRSGGLYQEGYAMHVFEGRKAHRIGDILTVMLQEVTQASKEAKTSIDKQNSTALNNPVLFGQPTQLSARETLGFNFGSTHAFDGDGKSSQNNALTGTITVTVYQVLPNGYLMIRGEKWVTLNQGEEFIRLRGIVRPDDIKPDNTVSSKLIANARIAYSGTGQVANSNLMGWLSRCFSGPLSPY